MVGSLSTELIVALQRRILHWYHSHRRDLPWRHTTSPYRILVAEFMLQQTQVQRVIPRYEEFLQRFPSLRYLAKATRAEVIRVWSPLGYNVRAVRLHQIAHYVVERCSGRLPQEVSELRTFKGIGPYSAAAVACFAYRQPVVVLDTNIRRVLARILLGQDPTRGRLHESQLQGLGAALLPKDKAYRWNQALMDLGALVCLAKKPACDCCPAQEFCAFWHRQRSLERIREAPASYGETAQRPKGQPFRESSRFYRGRILDVLRALLPDASLDVPSVGRAIKPEFDLMELPWLERLLGGLQRDGLIALISGSPTRVTLP